MSRDIYKGVRVLDLGDDEETDLIPCTTVASHLDSEWSLLGTISSCIDIVETDYGEIKEIIVGKTMLSLSKVFNANSIWVSSPD